MKKIVGILILTIALALYLWFDAGDTFASEYNLKNLARHTAFLAILAIGQALVIITGGIDLSIGSIVGFSALFMAYLISIPGFGALPAAGVVVTLMLGVGLIQGQLVVRLKIQPFIATLAGMMLLRGTAKLLTEGATQSMETAPEAFKQLGNGVVLNFVPIPVALMLCIAVIFAFIMNRTVFGRHLYAIGRNETAAHYSGINVGFCKSLAYVLCALLACITGLLYAPYLSSVQPNFGTGFELYAIAAAVLGGCSLRGGEGQILGIIIGAILMRLLYNAITLLGISTFAEDAIIGGVILTAALMDAFFHRKAA